LSQVKAHDISLVPQLLRRSGSYTKLATARSETNDVDSGPVISSAISVASLPTASITAPRHRDMLAPLATAAAVGLASPFSLRASPVPPLESHPVGLRASPTARVLSAANFDSPSLASSLSLEQLAARPIDSLHYQRFHPIQSAHPIPPCIPLHSRHLSGAACGGMEYGGGSN
jgi:hypothetical protein